MRFWDASALVPLCIEQPSSIEVRQLIHDDPRMAVWWGSPVECWSAFSRLRREGALNAAEDETARLLLTQLHRAWTEIEPSEQVRGHAARLLRIHLLRALDALQLGAAAVWAGSPAAGEIVTFDARLREAARLEGFGVLPH